ncbi:hypothetical protein [Halobellus rarus]|uniref:Uncharacterized protein n=1 Tax=Halobellus rarus TaxID=1126237 RepID=A0ABD6CM15_9EURY|nr:hypothetical protein [Halobellus rarus]
MTSNEHVLPAGLRTVFRLHALVVAGATLPLIFIPVVWAELVGWAAVDVTLARLLGGALLATTVGSLLASRVRTYAEVRTYLLFEQTVGTLIFLVAAYEVLFGGAPPFTWAFVAVPGVFSLARMYYLLYDEELRADVPRPAS